MKNQKITNSKKWSKNKKFEEWKNEKSIKIKNQEIKQKWKIKTKKL